MVRFEIFVKAMPTSLSKLNLEEHPYQVLTICQNGPDLVTVLKFEYFQHVLHSFCNERFLFFVSAFHT